MIDYQVFIDFQHPEMIRVPVVQGDTESRRITFVMYNGSAEYNPQTDLDTVLTVALSYLKPDGTGGQYDTMPDGETPAGSLSGNVCVLRLAPQTMSAAGLVLCNLVLFNTQGVTLQTFPFVLDVKRSAGMEITSQDYYNVQTIEGVSQSLMHMVQSVNNARPDVHGNVSLLPWQLPYNGVIGGQQVGDVEEALDMLARMQAEIISQEIKDAIINAFAHVAWIDEHGQDYVDALEQAMRSKLISISAVFNQGSATIYDTDDIEILRQYLTVTALYSDNTTRTVTGYTLSGTLTDGTSTITVSYGGKTTTFDVVVTGPLYSIPDFAEQTITGSGTAKISKANGVFTLKFTNNEVVYVYPDGTVHSSKSNTTWFSTAVGQRLVNQLLYVDWVNPNSVGTKLQSKFARSDTTGNLYTAEVTMEANGSGSDDSGEYVLDPLTGARNLSCLAFQFVRASGSGAYPSEITASFKIRLFVDGVRYL